MHHAKLTIPRTALTLLLVGTVTLVAAIDRDSSLTVLGILLVIASMLTYGYDLLLREIRSVNRPADDAFSEGYESGYDRGWRDGNDHARPALVGLVGGASSGLGVADSCGPAVQPSAGCASKP